MRTVRWALPAFMITVLIAAPVAVTVVLITHEHRDHNKADLVRGAKQVLRGAKQVLRGLAPGARDQLPATTQIVVMDRR